MAQTKLGILIETLYKGKGAKAAEKDLKGLDKAAEKSTGRLDRLKGGMGNIALAAGAMGVAIYTAKKVFDFGAEGAQIEKVRDTFDSLSASIGMTSAALMVDLREATAGMVADTDLMMSANRLISMGLATTGEEASKLTEIAVTLGSAMGKDATQSMEEFALMLANQSIPRLDTFGISAGKVKQRIKELQAEFKDMTREEAFMRAVNEEAAISMAILGDTVPVDEFSKFSTELKNVTDAAKVTVAQGLGPLIGLMNEGVSQARILDATLVLLEGDWKKQNEIVKEVITRTDDQVQINKLLIEVNKLLQSEIQGTTEELVGYAEAILAANERAAGANRYYADWLKIVQGTTEQVVGSHIDVDEAIKKTADTVGYISDEYIYLAGDPLDQFERSAVESNYAATAAGEVFRAKVDEIKNAILGVSQTSDEKKRAVVELWLEANAEAKTAKEEIEKVHAELDKLDGKSVDAHITIHTSEIRTISEQTSTLGGIPEFAGGANFIVPPGYPNDTFAMRVSSGEHVQVTPAGTSNQLTNNHNNQTVIINTGLDQASLMRALEQAGIRANAMTRTIS
jgi:hypothetical protein